MAPVKQVASGQISHLMVRATKEGIAISERKTQLTGLVTADRRLAHDNVVNRLGSTQIRQTAAQICTDSPAKDGNCSLVVFAQGPQLSCSE